MRQSYNYSLRRGFRAVTVFLCAALVVTLCLSAAPKAFAAETAAPVSQDQADAASVSQEQTDTAPASQEQTDAAPVSQDQTAAAPALQEQTDAAPVSQDQVEAEPAPQNPAGAATVTPLAIPDIVSLDLGNGLTATVDRNQIAIDTGSGTTKLTVPVTVSGTATEAGFYTFKIRHGSDSTGTLSIFTNGGTVNKTGSISFYLYSAPYDNQVTLSDAGYQSIAFTGASSLDLGNGLTAQVDTAAITAEETDTIDQLVWYYSSRTFNIPVKVSGTAQTAGLHSLNYGYAAILFGVLPGAVEYNADTSQSLSGVYDAGTSTVTYDLSGISLSNNSFSTNVTKFYYDDNPQIVNGVSISLRPTSNAGRVVNSASSAAMAYRKADANNNYYDLELYSEGVTTAAGMLHCQFIENGSLMYDSSAQYVYAGSDGMNSQTGIKIKTDATYSAKITFSPFSVNVVGTAQNIDIGNGVFARIDPSILYITGGITPRLNFYVRFSGTAISNAIHEPEIGYTGSNSNVSKEIQKMSFSVLQGTVDTIDSMNSKSVSISLLSETDTTINLSDFSFTKTYDTNVYKIYNTNDQWASVPNDHYYTINGMRLFLVCENPMIIDNINGITGLVSRPINAKSSSDNYEDIGIVKPSPTLRIYVRASGTATQAGSISWSLLVNGEPVDPNDHSYNVSGSVVAAGAEPGSISPLDGSPEPSILLDEYPLLIDGDKTLSLTGSFSPTPVTADPPQIITDPQSVSAQISSEAVFTVSAYSIIRPLSYQWQVNNGGGWVNANTVSGLYPSGYNTSKLIIVASNSRDGYQFRCIVSNAGGSVTSNAATLTVTGSGGAKDITPPVITLNGSASMTLAVGDTWTDPGATAKDAVDGVVPVTASGIVNTNIAGTYTITYTARDKSGNTATATRVVTVTAASAQKVVQVTAIRLAQTTFYVVKGKTLTIPYAYDLAPGSTGQPVFTWSSDQPANVSVDQNGTVKGLVTGKSAKITITSDNGVSKTFMVKVVKAAMKATGVSISKPPKTLKVGQTAVLKVKVSPSKATGAVAKFSSSKKSVATVDNAGKVTAIAKGTVKITVKEGGKKTVITITVK